MSAQLSKKQQKIQKNREEMRGGASADMYNNYAIAAFVLLFGAGIAQFAAMACGICGSKSSGVGAGSWAAGGPVGVLDVTNEEQVKKAFFEGNPYIVYCQNDKSEGAVPKVISDISGELSQNKGTDDVQVVAANCFKKMMNGKTIAEQWNFGKKDGFIAVFTAGKKPVQLNYMPTGKYVAKQVKPMVKTGVQRVVYLRDFEGCQGNKNCVILASKNKEVIGRMEARVKPLMKNNRDLTVVSVDSSFYKVTVDADFAKQKPEQGEDAQYGEAICVAKNTHSDDFEEFKDAKAFKIMNAKRGAKVNKAKFMKSWGSDAEIEAFLDECQNGEHSDWYQLSKDVAVKARSGETKHIKAPENPKLKKAKNDGTKKGKEAVGQRPDETPEEDDEEDEEGEEEEEVEEEVEL